MTIEEFKQKLETIVLSYGFVKTAVKNWKGVFEDHYVIKTKDGKPDASFEMEDYDYFGKPALRIRYNTVSFTYSPWGNLNMTSKSDWDVINDEKKIAKFKWEVFEKWAQFEQSVVSNYLMLNKQKEIQKKLKIMEKDFKVTKK